MRPGCATRNPQSAIRNSIRNPKFLLGCVEMISLEPSSSMNATEATLPRIQHVTITFPSGSDTRLREFYVGTLGLREKRVPKVVQHLGWIWFDTGIPGVELHCVPDEEPVP